MDSNQSAPDLVVNFSKIELPESIDFGDEGEVKIKVRNEGRGRVTEPVTVNLYISTDMDIDDNDTLLASEMKTLNGRGNTTFNLEYENDTSVIAPGAYHLIAEVVPVGGESNTANNVVSELVSAEDTNVINDWIATALNVIQAQGEAGLGVGPTVGSRLLAILTTAIYDTVNAFNDTDEFYAVDEDAPRRASKEAAVVGAAYEVLSDASLYFTELSPEAQALIDEQLEASLQEIKDGRSAESRGLDFGKDIANQIIDLRAEDGSNPPNPEYVAPTASPIEGALDDYVWTPDTDGFALGAEWGNVTPWVIGSVDEFAPDGLDGYPAEDPNSEPSQLYATELEEVQTLGGLKDTTLTEITRTIDQSEVALFWAYDRPDTFRPYGQLFQIASEISVREETSLEETAALFAALGTSFADAAIVAWNAKYDFVQPRPNDVIAGDNGSYEGVTAATDGIESTVFDEDWDPFLDIIGIQRNDGVLDTGTPPFPDYLSGHSTFGGTWAGVLTAFFGDNYEFEAVSQELSNLNLYTDDLSNYDPVRSFDSFFEAGSEDAISRLYGGVHVLEATEDAVNAGLVIGEFVASQFQPINA
jgi:hypothetical protein